MRIITGALGRPHVTSNDDGELNQAIFGSDLVVLPNGNKLSAEVIDNNTIRISDGDLVMQGRHALINPGETEDVTIESATIGYNRKDLIVVHYELDTQTGYEDISLRVLKGSETSSAAQPPAYTEGDIRTGSTVAELPLYEVAINKSGSIEEVTLKARNMNFDIADFLINRNSKDITGIYASADDLPNGFFTGNGLANQPTDRSSWYFYFTYGYAGTRSFRTQIAISMNDTLPVMYIRDYNGGAGWSRWMQFKSTRNDFTQTGTVSAGSTTGTWTAEHDGVAYCTINVSASANSQATISVNDKAMFMYKQTQASGSSSCANSIRMNRGDKLSWATANGANVYIYYYFN